MSYADVMVPNMSQEMDRASLGLETAFGYDNQQAVNIVNAIGFDKANEIVEAYFADDETYAMSTTERRSHFEAAAMQLGQL